jgi:diphosphomevalonate decarboxylase
MAHLGAPGRATARAAINVALVKYWGKRDPVANLPDVGSISLTLDGPGSETTVAFDPALEADVFELDRDTGEVRQLLAPDAWDLRLVIASPTTGPKAVSSREAMERCKRTSPYYAAWRDTHPADLDAAREAIAARDLQALGRVMERSTMKMHACMLAADPPIRYWRAETMALLDVVESQRPQVGGWYTMDAGPHVKVLCTAADVAAVRAAVEPLAREVRVCAPGRGATVEVE